MLGEPCRNCWQQVENNCFWRATSNLRQITNIRENLFFIRILLDFAFLTFSMLLSQIEKAKKQKHPSLVEHVEQHRC